MELARLSIWDRRSRDERVLGLATSKPSRIHLGLRREEMAHLVPFCEEQFIQILFPSMILDGFSLLLASTDFLSFILSIVGIVLKISLYFSGRRVLLEKGGQSMGGFASLDPRGGFNGFSSGGGGRGQVLGQSENAGNQTSQSI
jgi:uncharacterized membrane protein YgcG